MNDDDNDYNFEEEDMFQPERDIALRTEYFNDDGDGIILNRKKGDIIKDPKSRFLIYIDAIARKLIDDRILENISTKSIKNILKYANTQLLEPRYKNPTCFVIAYAVCKNGIIDTKILKNLKLNDIQPRVRLEDIIRYCNLWLNIIK